MIELKYKTDNVENEFKKKIEIEKIEVKTIKPFKV